MARLAQISEEEKAEFKLRIAQGDAAICLQVGRELRAVTDRNVGTDDTGKEEEPEEPLSPFVRMLCLHGVEHSKQGPLGFTSYFASESV